MGAHYWTKENFIRYFEERIRPLCKSGRMLKHDELRKKGFGAWTAALYSHCFYRGLDDFSAANGLSCAGRGRKSKGSLANSKELFERYFEKKIFPKCKDGVMPTTHSLQKDGHSHWCTCLYRHYDSVAHFAKAHRLRRREGLGITATKESVDAFFEKKILPKMGERMPKTSELFRLGYREWVDKVYRTKEYGSLRIFAESHGLDVEKRKGRTKLKVPEGKIPN